MAIKSYAEMRKIDVLPFCDQREAKDDKGRPIKVPYLNWAKCKELLHQNGAENVYFEPCTNANGSSLFMSDQVFTDSKGNTNRCYEVRVKIVIDDLEFEAQYPLMNGSNPVKDNSLTQQRVWNAQTRAFVKGVAMRTGLGFGLWLDDMDDRVGEESIEGAEDINVPSKPSKRFTPPTVEEVAQYCFDRMSTVDPQRFVDYYTSNGWMVGKNKMKDWKAAVRTWEQKIYGRIETGRLGREYPPKA